MKSGETIRGARSNCYRDRNGQNHESAPRTEILKKLRRRYQRAGSEPKRKLLDQAQQLLNSHRQSAIRALRTPSVERGPRIITGRPAIFLLPWRRAIWPATDYACGRRLVTMWPEWVPAYEHYERRLASSPTLPRIGI